MESIKHKDIMQGRYTFTRTEVSDYQQIVRRIMPELPETDARHIAEYCYVYCKSPIEEEVYDAINHFYEVFDLPNQLILGEPSY